jgi:hypothetical protein
LHPARAVRTFPLSHRGNIRHRPRVWFGWTLSGARTRRHAATRTALDRRPA